MNERQIQLQASTQLCLPPHPDTHTHASKLLNISKPDTEVNGTKHGICISFHLFILQNIGPGSHSGIVIVFFLLLLVKVTDIRHPHLIFLHLLVTECNNSKRVDRFCHHLLHCVSSVYAGYACHASPRCEAN